ncbi:MAG TPA: hypothetical protein VKA70_02165 [Blastocatellia bacterium]|nr:hypothetical protein [Blastocatellia bacterium]
MKTNQLRRKIGGAALMLAMMIGITIAASSTAQAQYPRYDDRNGRYDDYNNQVRWSRDRERQYAYALGYHNAYTEGRDRGRSMDYRQSQAYRNNDNGYRPWMGDMNTYRDNYRRGAEAGFKDGESGRARRYDRQDVERLLGARMVDVYGESDDNGWWGDRRRDNGRWDDRGNGRWDDRGNNRNDVYRIAQQNGYRDGVRRGQEDRSRNRRFDYDDSSDYRDASRGYRSEYGNREAYRNAYRDAFRSGYEDGYRNNRSNNRFPWPF